MWGSVWLEDRVDAQLVGRARWRFRCRSERGCGHVPAQAFEMLNLMLRWAFFGRDAALRKPVMVSTMDGDVLLLLAPVGQLTASDEGRA